MKEPHAVALVKILKLFDIYIFSLIFAKEKGVKFLPIKKYFAYVSNDFRDRQQPVGRAVVSAALFHCQ